MLSKFFRALAPRTTAHAHCDIPCGVYDPQQARIEAESCYKIIQKYQDSSDELFRARCIHVKEERAELTKSSPTCTRCAGRHPRRRRRSSAPSISPRLRNSST